MKYQQLKHSSPGIKIELMSPVSILSASAKMASIELLTLIGIPE